MAIGANTLRSAGAERGLGSPALPTLSLSNLNLVDTPQSQPAPRGSPPATDDFVVVVVALVVGVAGIVLEVVLGSAAIHGLGSLL